MTWKYINSPNARLRFSGFIMTYERPVILLDSIKRIFEQSFSPEKLLVIDNSFSDRTKLLISELADKRIIYYRVGENYGPAGAASIGLRILTDQGYDWIYWGDDDDPPHFPDAFEKMLTDIDSDKIGIIGATGNRFSRLTGELIRVRQDDISAALREGKKWLPVDSVAGNQAMIINSKVVQQGILPDPQFFFGLEELDYCIRVKTSGFSILTHTELFNRSRIKFNRINYTRPIYSPFPAEKLHREYYSTRNGVFLLIRQGLWFGLILKVFKSFLKILLGFKLGFSYGIRNAQLIILGLMHGWSRKMFRANLPVKWE
jgi:GT2 family glycosyltransferase